MHNSSKKAARMDLAVHLRKAADMRSAGHRKSEEWCKDRAESMELAELVLTEEARSCSQAALLRVNDRDLIEKNVVRFIHV